MHGNGYWSYKLLRNPNACAGVTEAVPYGRHKRGLFESNRRVKSALQYRAAQLDRTAENAQQFALSA